MTPPLAPAACSCSRKNLSNPTAARRSAKSEVRVSKFSQFGISPHSSFQISPRPTTRRFALIHFAMRGIEADIGPEHADTFRRDLHPDLRADWQIANAEVRMWN